MLILKNLRCRKYFLRFERAIIIILIYKNSVEYNLFQIDKFLKN